VIGRFAPAVVLIFVAAVAPARAEAAPSFELALEGCPTLDAARLRELITIELETLGAAATPRATSIRLTCVEDRVAIALTDTATGGRATSDLDVSATPQAARPRLLALTVTELVALTWAELRAPLPQTAPSPPPPPPPLPPTPQPIAVVTAPPARTPSRVRLFAVASLRRIGQPGTWLSGAGIGGELRLSPHFALTADVRAEVGDTSTALAAIHWRDAAGTLGLAIGAGRGRFWWDVVPGFTVGLVRLSATPATPDASGATLSGPWGGPSLSSRLRRSFGAHAYLQLELGAGAVSRSLVGLVNGSAPLVRIQGVWGTMGVGAGVVF
jgi:hypothetical protein